ncbi:MAG: hypothetical protein GQ574_03510 [Crocinitomix sp.]|nr:hypothetical protein [Crocinitomix sp.]
MTPKKLDIYVGSLPTKLKYYYVNEELYAEIDFGIIFSQNELKEISLINNRNYFNNNYGAINELEITNENLFNNFSNQFAAIESQDFSRPNDTLKMTGNGYQCLNDSYMIYKRRLLMKNNGTSMEFSWLGDADFSYYNGTAIVNTNILIQENADIPSKVNLDKERDCRPMSGTQASSALYYAPH